MRGKRYSLHCEGEHAEFVVLDGETFSDKLEEVLYILYGMEPTNDDDIYTVDGDFYDVYVQGNKVTVTLMD